MSYEMELTPVEEEQYHQSLLSHATQIQIPNNSAMTQNTTNTNANIDNNNEIEEGGSKD